MTIQRLGFLKKKCVIFSIIFVVAFSVSIYFAVLNYENEKTKYLDSLNTYKSQNDCFSLKFYQTMQRNDGPLFSIPMSDVNNAVQKKFDELNCKAYIDAADAELKRLGWIH